MVLYEQMKKALPFSDFFPLFHAGFVGLYNQEVPCSWEINVLHEKNIILKICSKIN